MKISVYRRIRHRAHTSETARSKNEQQHEQSFFGENTHDPFFKSSNRLTAQSGIQLKPLNFVTETNQINRMEDQKEEDQKEQRSAEGEREKVQKKEDEKEGEE